MTRATVMLVGLLALAAAPRLVDIHRPGLTYDELYDLEDSQRFCAQGRGLEPISDGYLNGQAPFFLACPAYALLGADERTARGLSAAAGLLTVLATYLLARRLMPAPWALLAAAWLGLSPLFLAASRLAFSHGHVFAVPWLLLALRAVLIGRPRLGTWGAGASCGLLAGFAAGNDLLAAPWAATLLLLALLRLGWRAGWGALARFLAGFGLAWAAGLALASPMYAAHPLRAVRDVASRLSWWDGQTDHLWLGANVAALPHYYYPFVLLVRLTPPVLVLVGLGLLRRWSPALRVCLPCLWPILLVTFKGWKSPFYLTPLLPLLFVIAAASLRGLVRALPRARRRWAVGATAAGVLAFQLAAVVDSHPDHLMGGIRYGAKLYGEFAGPAVSHGQWVPEALQRVRDDASGRDVVVLVPLGYVPRQVALYSARLGLSQVHTPDRLRRGLNPRDVDYVVVSHEVLAHAEGRRLNGALLALVADGGAFRQLSAVRTSGFPTATIWKRIDATSRSAQVLPRREASVTVQ